MTKYSCGNLRSSYKKGRRRETRARFLFLRFSTVIKNKNPLPICNYAFGSNARVSALGCGFARVRRGNTFRSFALGRRFGPAYVYRVLCISTARLARRRASRVFFFRVGRRARSAPRVIRPFSSSSSTRRGDRRCGPSRKGTPFRRTRECSRRPTGSRSSRTPS